MILSKEKISAVLDLNPGYSLGVADVVILYEMARQQLAAEAQEPVYQCMDDGHWYDTEKRLYDEVMENGGTCRVLYAAPPAPVAQPVQVPELKSLENLEHKPLSKSYREGWNACCTAMLKGDE